MSSHICVYFLVLLLTGNCCMNQETCDDDDCRQYQSKAFHASPLGFDVSDEMMQAFEKDGFFILRGLLDATEVRMLREAAESGLEQRALLQSDGEQTKVKLALWKNLGDDVISCIARSEKVVGAFEKLLGGEIYHWHSKIIMKDAFSTGSHIWHQDYGYWYENGCLMPNLGTVSIAIDKADRGNGCLRVIPGSHLAGRLTHKQFGKQAGADMERVNHLHEQLGVVHVELNPGDAVFFHSNLLHRSNANDSPRRRWAYLIAYNRRDNEPFTDDWHPNYSPIKKMMNSDIKDCPVQVNLDKHKFYRLQDDPAYGRLPSSAH